MDSRRIVCHACQEVQRDRWTYRNHLLRVHGQVIRGGTSTLVRLEGRELEQVWAADYTRLLEASHRREAMGLPRVPDQEAARRLHDNRARRDRRGRAVSKNARASLTHRHASSDPRRRPSYRRHASGRATYYTGRLSTGHTSQPTDGPHLHTARAVT